MRRRVLTAALHAAPGARRALSTGAAASTSAEQAADSLASLLKTHHITPSAPLDPPSLARRLKFLEALGVKDLAKAARARPELLHTEPEALASRLNYLLGLGVTNLRAAVRHAPALLTSNLTHDLHLKVLILGSLGVTDIAKFIERYPRIVNLDLETQMRPATELLRSIDGLDIGRVMNKIPTIAFNVDYLRQRIEFLQEIGVQKLGRVITRHPNLLAYSVEGNMRPKIQWFGEKGFSDVASLITHNPSLLSMPIENRLAPTLELLLGPLGRTVGEIERFPRIFNYSIELLTLRHDFLVESERNGKFGLTRIYRSSPYTFATKLAGRSIDEWEDFLARRAHHRVGSPRAGDRYLARMAEANAKSDARRMAIQHERERVAKLVQEYGASAAADSPAEAVESVKQMLEPQDEISTAQKSTHEVATDNLGGGSEVAQAPKEPVNST